MKKIAVTLLLTSLLSSCCGGPDPVRVRAEKASLALAKRCADGWFMGLPVTAEDEALVRKSLADWESRLLTDEGVK